MIRPGSPGSRRDVERRERSLDNLLQRFSCGVARRSVDGSIAVTSAWLRSMQELRAAQLESARQAEEAHQQAAARIAGARSFTELSSTQMDLWQAVANGLLDQATQTAAIGTRSIAAVWGEWFAASQRMNAELASLLGFASEMAMQPRSADTIEAQAEHVLNPIGASVFGWPAQEASREWLTAARAFGAAWPSAANEGGNGGTPTMH